jgi:hypothetical protein
MLLLSFNQSSLLVSEIKKNKRKPSNVQIHAHSNRIGGEQNFVRIVGIIEPDDLLLLGLWRQITKHYGRIPLMLRLQVFCHFQYAGFAEVDYAIAILMSKISIFINNISPIYQFYIFIYDIRHK